MPLVLYGLHQAFTYLARKNYISKMAIHLETSMPRSRLNSLSPHQESSPLVFYMSLLVVPIKPSY